MRLNQLHQDGRAKSGDDHPQRFASALWPDRRLVLHSLPGTGAGSKLIKANCNYCQQD